MIKNLFPSKNQGLLSPMKYKKVNLISLNKTIIIPTFNSLTKCSTNRNTSSFSIQIPTIIKNKFVPKIKKFNESKDIIPSINAKTDIYTRNSKIINLKSFPNRTNDYNYNKKFFSLKIFQNSKKSVSNINNINNNNIEVINKKSPSIFKPSKFSNLSFNWKKKDVNISRNSELKKNPIKLSDKSFNGKYFKSIFNKRNNSIKLDIFNEIKKDLNYKKDEIKKENTTLLNNEDNCKKNENKNVIINNIKRSKNRDKFLKFILKNNYRIKTKNIDLIKTNIIKKYERKIKNTINEKINNKQFIITRKNNNNRNEKKFVYIKKIAFIIEEEKIKKDMENMIFNVKKIVSNICTKGIINEYLAIAYKTKELVFNYIKTFNLNKSNSLDINYNLIEMKLLHINVEYEIDSSQKKIKINQNKIIKPTKRINIFDFCKINSLKNTKHSKIITNKYWKKYSLLKNASFFKKKNKINYSNIYCSRRNSFYMNKLLYKINQNNKIITKNLIKKNDFEKLKYLIQEKRDSQFEFEFLKIINNSDINTCDKDGNTLLILATMNGNLEIVKYLLENGANPNCVNLVKNTPLHYAIAKNEYYIADLLLQYGAKDNIENIDGLTPWQIYFLFI